jgi:hypothetical protein
MSIDETLLTLAQELMAEWDPTVDTSDGSSFRSQVLDPLLTRVGGSPLEVDLETFLVERLETEIEDVDVSPFSAMRDLGVRAHVVMSDPLQREVEGVKVTQSLNNYQQMTREELDALLGNYFTALQEGEKARGLARMYFPAPQSITVTVGTQFSTGSGLNFFPTTVQSITATQMSFLQEGELYYFDVLVEAEEASTDYNIDVDEISSVVGVSGVTRVTNQARFTTGLAEESKEEAVVRTQNSITIRNLITARGAAFVIPENFPVIDTLQIIGFGDEEMLRDIIRGPTEVSEIPGGISGSRDVDLAPGQFIHIGGMTDIYVYQATPDEEDIDIENLTDKGQRIYAGTHGFTQSGLSTDLFEDEFGFFLKRGVQDGDILLLGEDEYTIVAAGVTNTSITVTPATIPAGLFQQTYDIVRRTAGQVTVPIYDLVAVDENGNAIITDSGLPAAPIPGSLTNEVLLDGVGAPVEKLANVSTENVLLPLLRVETVEFLDPLTKEPLGQVIPMRDLVLVEAVDGFDDGAVGVGASGFVRLYFRDAVNCWVRWNSPTSVFHYDEADIAFFPLEQVNESGVARVDDLNSQEIILESTGAFPTGDYTGAIAIGDRIEVSGASPNVAFLVVNTTYNAGPMETVIEVREDLNDHFGATFSGADVESFAGILEANMSQDPNTGMYFVDFEVQTTDTGTVGNIPIGSFLRPQFVNSEGWTLKTVYSVLSYSTRELPYLQVSEWVNDTTRLFVTFTAPAVRVSYEYAGQLADIQAFADDPANRIVSEDVLIRHFVPSYVRGNWAVNGLDLDVAKETMVSYINALDPTEDLEVSDVVNSLYQAGATHVLLPATLTKLTQNRDRTWDGAYDQDTLGSSRIQHFIADEDFITVVEA